MRVTSVDMYSATFEEAISFSLQGSDPNAQYMIRTIIGLDADDIVPKFYGWGIGGENRFYDFSLKPRDVVLRVVLNPRAKLEETYSEIRDDLYRTISANRTGIVKLHFNSGATTVSSITGSIVKFESAYFNKLPEVQITIRCNDPIFKAINPVIFGPTELFTTNPVHIPDSLSTAPHGFTAQFTFKTATPTFTIQDDPTTPEWKFKINWGANGQFEVGDVLYLSSEYSNKYIYIIRAGVTIQLANLIEPTSLWPILFPGQNEFYIPEIDTFDWNELKYYASYWGV